jgi:hypothetical protein
MRVRQSRITEQKTISILMVSEVLKADWRKIKAMWKTTSTGANI